MITSILKVVLAGILGGFLLFAIPFLLIKAFFFLLFIGLAFRMFSGRRHFGRWRRQHPFYEHFDDFEVVQEKESMRDQFNKYPKQV